MHKYTLPKQKKIHRADKDILIIKQNANDFPSFNLPKLTKWINQKNTFQYIKRNIGYIGYIAANVQVDLLSSLIFLIGVIR